MLWFLLLLLATGGLILFLSGDSGTIAGLDPASFAGLVAGGALLLYFAASLAGSYRGRSAQAVKDLAVWVLIAFALVAAYSFRDEVSYVARRMAGELLPPGEAVVFEGRESGEQAVRIRRRPDGHFSVRAQVNGAPVTMLVDTGASTLVLRPADARRAGIDTDRLVYSVPVQTANGTAYAAAARLRDVAIGPIRLDRVEALVAKPGVLEESLLGMNFLRRLRSYEFSGEFLTLRS
ncbi:MAG: TIGR02281 family clan AA aspartic protease [Hyphomicrobiaceae bacterium]|nr:TIGR02281 family clan AA aspartic protease [Hyphomicrobiaceae bacterium]